ncbi:Trp biosynthesis-associated membrane protein [Pseudarthrobacter cellobiosi]|uniref:Trp biosynthesis-associated membrane protein n=1 Tax=Pseudarthrobacter cellobiosi TaxID=2953654 RepID=UPI00208E2420|nr:MULTISPECIES: Trp biosynthesis-associated membrane protein [unclassified Pseudarthrobacter]MCO4256457.1 Trp biosynthesis-associated membrane protein [Pseudarthrobacter sp. HLT1-5]MCO4276078.1 Trp biosynthesis-associated membrane protein [Pseudarthrobacter sp. HLT3-5]
MTPAWARKSTLVLLIAVLALAVFGTTTQTWITVTLDANQVGQTAGDQNTLPVQGSKAATTVTALALVALAGGLAASIAGKFARWVITAIIMLASVGIIAAAATVLADPLGASQGSIAAATGVTGGNAEVAVTAFPVLAVVAGSLLALAALLIIPAGRHWKSRTKYDATTYGGPAGSTAAATGPVDEIDSWDRLSRGDDPT